VLVASFVLKGEICVCCPVYATTASNPDESSYACYFDDERQTYLGDVYSVNWMEDSDAVRWVSIAQLICSKMNTFSSEWNKSFIKKP